MKFIDRHQERTRLEQLVSRNEGGLAVIWGRRRIGKTRLLLEWCRARGGLYSVADQSTAPVQRRYLAAAVSSVFDGFADVEYPDWRAYLSSLSRAAKMTNWRGPYVIDELPYLVSSDRTFPSVMQAWLDHEAKEAKLAVAVAGSAQHMMHGLVLDAASPLYGRAVESLRLGPISAGYISEGLGLKDPLDCIRTYAIWGGVPRYWELAAPYGNMLENAVDELVLDPLGPLHLEPDRLLAGEMPSATSLRPLLDVIGAGAHRISEMGGRLGQSATSLSRPLSRLCELGFARREQPFGVSERKSKRTLYFIDDPFLKMWFQVVAPRRAFLATASPKARKSLWRKAASKLFANTFEQLCRTAVPHVTKGPLAPFGPSGRRWETGGHEWDVVALSEGGKKLLLGEVKWREADADERVVERAGQDLVRKGVPNNPAWKDLDIVQVVFLPRLIAKARKHTYAVHVVEARELIAALR